ncbi:hypothetical protein [Paludisphaera rhizosphaerae]|uniref:hypothetical protein n=1 Tax=Paludisphaera rhizosphaerae TaxID=2711216 RepID=UPI0013EDFD2E|nr:hypothetical protein [Paludisphaera rhizosphaerae]
MSHAAARKARSSRSFKPASEGLESRVQLSGSTAGVVTIGANPGIISLPTGTLKADIVLESLSVQPLGNNQFRVTAVLENEGLPVVAKPAGIGSSVATSVGVAYAGGGVLQIARTSGGTNLNGVPTGPVLATPDPATVIASMPIPALAFHQTIQLSTVTQGRAIFTASAVPAVVNHLALPFPDANTANNTRTVDSLIAHTYPINTATLGLLPSLNTAVQGAKLRLDANNSEISIPGVIDQHFQIPGKTVTVGVFPLSVSATYYVNNLVTSGVSLSYEKGGLAITVKFADNQHALHTPSSLFPDFSVSNLQVKVFLPLTYNAQYQYFQFGQATTTVTGSWHAGGPFGSVIDLLVPDINSKVSSAVTSLVDSKLDALSHMLNQAIHGFIAGGRITSAVIGQNQLDLSVETPT